MKWPKTINNGAPVPSLERVRYEERGAPVPALQQVPAPSSTQPAAPPPPAQPSTQQQSDGSF